MKILGLSSRKGGGKNSCANFVLGVYLIHYGIVRGTFNITNEGLLNISDIFGDESNAGILNQDCYSDPTVAQFWYENIFPHIKLYSFASLLKRNICMEVLGLSHEQCFGTDEQKNSLTKLQWQDMPIMRTDKREPLKEGPMSARQVMQFVGTDLFRKMYEKVWVEATIKQIKTEQPELAIVTDCRFPDEIEGIQQVGGKVIRLHRAPFKEDEHESEKALDNKNFHYSKFDAVLSNQNMTIPQQSESLYNILRKWDFVPEIQQ